MFKKKMAVIEIKNAGALKDTVTATFDLTKMLWAKDGVKKGCGVPIV
jgi:hypothetical protein